jgi:hypothetical protein
VALHYTGQGVELDQVFACVGIVMVTVEGWGCGATQASEIVGMGPGVGNRVASRSESGMNCVNPIELLLKVAEHELFKVNFQ